MRREAVRLGVAVLALGAVFAVARPASADMLEDLRTELQERRSVVQNIEERIRQYREDAAKKKQEAVTLESQIGVIDDGITVLTLQIDKTEAEVKAVEADIAATEEEIREVERDVDRLKELLQEYMRTLQLLDADSTVEAIFKYATLSEAITQVRQIYRVEQKNQETLDRITVLRTTLTDRVSSLTDLQRELETLRTRQTSQKTTLEDQKNAKNRLLEITKEQEAEFKKLLGAAIADQRRANSEIASVDARIRAELEKRGLSKLGSVGTFDWPIVPIFGVSCAFHCPGYPYENLIGPHTGIDLPTHVGTTIGAAADGYVGRVSIASGTGYSYILLIHGENLSTVYGHISAASVSEGTFVTRGQPIGSTGGAPGSRGAGLSSGPHLHFEVRKDGIPSDPLAFLP
jgi:murein DD-endopeptidase MepM/ murein hydrolase activator NlpD